jgi:hypothetical protein
LERVFNFIASTSAHAPLEDDDTVTKFFQEEIFWYEETKIYSKDTVYVFLVSFLKKKLPLEKCQEIVMYGLVNDRMIVKKKAIPVTGRGGL